jgi:hypothetical protein
MPDPWLTFAPLQPHWVLPRDIVLPYYLSEHVSIRPVPEWVRAADTPDMLLARLREKLKDGARYCIAVEYEADDLGSPDPDRTTKPPRSIQQTAADKIHYANLALWLARPTDLSFDLVAHAVNHGIEWVTRQIVRYEPIRALPDYQSEEYTLADIEKSRRLYQGLDRISRDGTVLLSGGTTMRALCETGWTTRFLLLWIAIECLFGPADPRETTFRLSQRIALFLESDEGNARELFEKVKDSYSWRSKVVHGLRLAKLNEEKSLPLLVDLEQFVRRSLLSILENDSMATIFDGG